MNEEQLRKRREAEEQRLIRLRDKHNNSVTKVVTPVKEIVLEDISVKEPEVTFEIEEVEDEDDESEEEPEITLYETEEDTSEPDYPSMGEMKNFAISIGALGVIVLTTVAVISGFKDTELLDNTTADAFETGLAIFATFTSVIVLALVGKIVVGLFVYDN